jgi:hypothetical protein
MVSLDISKNITHISTENFQHEPFSKTEDVTSEGRIISGSVGERKDQKAKLLPERSGLCKYLEKRQGEVK